MKLTNKEDKKIKKFLKSICEDFTESKIYNSIHYSVTINGVLRDIRFSDHLSNKPLNSILDIIKSTETTYMILYDKKSLQYTASVEEVFDIVKSFVVLAEIIGSYIVTQKTYTDKAIKERANALSKEGSLLKKLEEKNAEIIKLSNTVANQKQVIVNKDEQVNKLNAQLNKTIKDRDQRFNNIAKIILNHD